MLEPRDRSLLFNTLRPPPGYHLDCGIGTTYSLDLLALLTAPLAFTLFERSDESVEASEGSLAVLESLRRYADTLTIFCHAGRIAVPRGHYPQFAYLEQSVVQCLPSHPGAFHPKVWLLRFVAANEPTRYRLLCLTRNLTFARSWDTVLALEGPLLDRKNALTVNHPLGDFIAALPSLARSVSEATRDRVTLLSEEVRRVQFELPEGFTQYRFWPLGIDRHRQWPFQESGRRLLIVSPFVSLERLERLAESRDHAMLVSTSHAMAGLSRRPAGFDEFFVLDEQATAEVSGEADEPEPDSVPEAVQLNDLHAKCYIVEDGWDAHIWTGSANATDAAFERNVEFLVELIGPRRLFGIDTLMTPEKDAVRLINLLKPAANQIGSQTPDELAKRLEEQLEQARDAIGRAHLIADVAGCAGDRYTMELQPAEAITLRLAPSTSISCWPITLPEEAQRPIKSFEDSVLAVFSNVSFEALTSFFAFAVEVRESDRVARAQFVINTLLRGAPADRHGRILKSLIRDRARLLRFLLLLLTEEGGDVSNLVEELDADRPNLQWRGTASGGEALLETLVRTLARAPERLDDVDRLMRDLAKDDEGRSLLPEGFEGIWTPIWTFRERAKQCKTTP